MAYCALTPVDWTARCATVPRGRLRAACARLATSQFPEASTLELNLLASAIGEFPEGFGELRFSHPVRSGRTVAEWAEFLESDPVALEALAFDANRAFDGCDVDRGVLFPTVTRSLCQPDGVTEDMVGPLGYTCRQLDDECSRGSERQRDGEPCCETVPRADGILCNEGTGACEAGVCVPGDFVPPGTDPDAGSTPDGGPPGDPVDPPVDPNAPPTSLPNTLGYVGDEHWLDIVGDHPVGLSLADGGFRVLVSGEAWVELPSAPVVANPDEPNPVELSLAHVRLSRDAELQAVGVLAPTAFRAILLPASSPGGAEFCVVRGDASDPRIALSDCSTRGERFTCDAAPNGIRCEVIDGLARIEAQDLLMAWPIPDSATPIRDVFGALGLCIEIPPFGCIGGPRPPQCRPGSVRSCQASCGAGLGLSFCGVFGWGRCQGVNIPRVAEVCNGRDDDCDGSTDEYTNFGCTDFLSCNTDVCTDGVCESEYSGVCDGGATTTCSTAFCGFAPAPPGGRRTPRNLLGCTVLLDDASCNDGCDCNGPDLCSGTVAGVAGNGCYPSGGRELCENSEPTDDLCTIAGCCSGDIRACAASPYNGTPRVMSGREVRLYERACNLLRARGETFLVPDPINPLAPDIECINETTFLGTQTYFEVVCPGSSHECTMPSRCDPDDGICQPAVPNPAFATCSTDVAGTPLPGPQCGSRLIVNTKIGHREHPSRLNVNAEIGERERQDRRT